MTSESKILTVSYGTFSCTLEGFDDPLNTMKAIAEYFRDLAAEDRYFGAEPPRPDAAMLHRIAEREVARLVEAKVGDTGVRLRPQADPVGVRAAEPGTGERVTGERGTGERVTGERVTGERVTGTPRAPRDVPAALQMPETVATEAPTIEPALQDVIPTGVAAKLARIRNSVDPQPITAPLAEEALSSFLDGEDDAEPVDLTADPAEDAGSDILNRLGTLINDPKGEISEVSAKDTAAQADEVASSVDSWLVETDDALLLSDVPETARIADLPELGAPPGPAHAAVDPDEEAFIASLAQATEFEEDARQPEAATRIEDYLPEEEPAGPATLDAALLEDPVAEEVSGSAPVEAEDLPEAPVNLAAPAVATSDEALVDGLAETVASDEPAEAVDTVTTSLDAALDLSPVSEDASATTEPVPDASAEPSEPKPAVAAPKTAGKTKRVSSRVVRIHADDDDAADPGATRVVKPDGDDAEVARLLRQADDVMAEEGNRRRLESIAHMKAAVAATEADRAASGQKPKAETETKLDPYRDVLAQVVQPDPAPTAGETPTPKPRRQTVSVRPQEPRPGTIRPGMISPPPLVLVSEQRIDRIDAPQPTPGPAQTPAPTPAAAEAAPMPGMRTGRLTGAIGIGAAAASPVMPQQKIVLEQPSRAGAVDLDEEDDLDEDLTEAHEAGLADFADRVGVKSMADMLEAAAAYATCVEKRENFTRPQLMRRLMASAGGKPISREEGLRSFGTLLRTGRIEKVSRGHYILAEHSPYLTEARRLG